MAVESSHQFKRPIYAGNAIISVTAPADKPAVATVRTPSWPAAGNGRSAAVEAGNVSVTLPTHTRFVGLQQGKSDRPDLQSASKVVSGGRALGSADAFSIIYSLADKMGAAVGACAPPSMPVTLKRIAGRSNRQDHFAGTHVAIGISGAIQHLTGIKDAGTIVVINKDGDAPIFEIADFGLVGDLFQDYSGTGKAL